MLRKIAEYAAVYSVIAVGVAMMVLFMPRPCRAMDDFNSPPTAHERYHHYYQNWLQPVPENEFGKVPTCCSATEYTVEGRHHVRGDCEPTQAELRPDGWYAKLPPYAALSGWPEWVRIPDEKRIKQTNPEPDAGHLCWIPPARGRDPSEGVLCFVPPFGAF